MCNRELPQQLLLSPVTRVQPQPLRSNFVLSDAFIIKQTRRDAPISFLNFVADGNHLDNATICELIDEGRKV